MVLSLFSRFFFGWMTRGGVKVGVLLAFAFL